MDGTPETMLHPKKVKKIYDEQGTSDQLKIIFILREPVSREISWYNHRLRYTKVPDPPSWTEELFNTEGKIKPFIELLRRTVITNFRGQQWKHVSEIFHEKIIVTGGAAVIRLRVALSLFAACYCDIINRPL